MARRLHPALLPLLPLLLILLAGLLPPGPWAAPLEAQSLSGSRASVLVQNRMARDHDFTFLDTPTGVRRFAAAGYLVEVRPTDDFRLHRVSFPYARPEVELFIRRLSSQYRRACGERLVVTSLTRPATRQPRNASSMSVHPTGMAVDLRRSDRRACRSWLEGTLLSLERAGVLEATRERYPPHYHVAIFPRPYSRYVARLTAGSGSAAASVRAPEPAPSWTSRYTVRPGDTLWSIARRHGTSVEWLRRENGLPGSRIYRGQTLRVPGDG